MQNIPIAAIPNQQFSVVLDNNQWQISLKTASGITAVSLTLNGTPVISGIRAAANMKVIPSLYEESGNFAFICADQNLPYYTLFGVTQMLVYFSPDELATIRVGTPSKITAAYFDPLGALPLRFIPVGYT